MVASVSLREFRSYRALELELEAGLVLVTGGNGVGKTNLLESLHVGTQAFSPRTRSESDLVRFGARAARVSVSGSEAATPVETEVVVSRGEGKQVRLNGASLRRADELRSRVTTLVFVPDRLAVVKGGPMVRRAYFDRALGRLYPARASLPGDYTRTLAQRNEALRRARAGISNEAAIEPWTQRVAALGSELDAARAELAALLAAPFRDRASTLGLAHAALRYDERPLSVEALAARLERDIARGVTTLGPHLRDVELTAGGRDLRCFGSQGEQRTAVLALVLAEADLVTARRSTSPLLLLDDVLSELDLDRRSALLAALPSGGQTVVTATTEAALPPGAAPPDLLVRVTPGRAERA
ncbi:MAG: DNA replication and repair protein RecF [Actinomycetota bacterium]|nr:DNA replication and repair protein RecF [Actinomycetota bacterium]